MADEGERVAEDVAALTGLLPEEDALGGADSIVATSIATPPLTAEAQSASEGSDEFGRVSTLRRANVVSYVFSSNLTMVFAIGVGLLTRKLLGPEFYGAFFFAVSIAGYLTVLNTPFNAMVDVEVPLLMGRGERDRVRTVLGGVYGLLFVLLVVEGTLLALGGAASSTGVYTQLAFVVVGISLVSDSYMAIDRLLLKAFSFFNELLVVSAITAIGYTVIVLGLTVAWGKSGFLAGMLIVSLSRSGLHRWVAARRIHFRWRVRHMAKEVGPLLVKRGGVIAMYRISLLGMESIDRLFVGAYMGFKSLGVYSLAVAATSLLSSVPQSIAGGVLPQYLRLRGSGRDERVTSATARLNATVMWCTCALALCGIAGLEAVVPRLFPAFKGAVRPGQILLAAEMFQEARFAPSSFVLGSRSRRPLMVASLVGFVAATAGAWVAALNNSLNQIAIVSAIAYFLSYCVLLATGELRGRWRLFAQSMSATAVVGLGVVVSTAGNLGWTIAYCGAGAIAASLLFLRAAGVSASTVLRQIVRRHRVGPDDER